MHNFNLFSKFFLILNVIVLNGCSPFSEETRQSTILEFEYTDSSLQQSALTPNASITGNLFLEIQEDLTNQTKTLVAKATFHNPASRNILFPDIFSGSLEKTIYEPIPEEEPCGIPGFPDCPSPKEQNNPIIINQQGEFL